MSPQHRPKSRLARGERLQIMLSPGELEAVDDYRFRQRMPSRAAAVRELFRLGLASAGDTQLVEGKKSSEFGVLDRRGSTNRAGADSDPSPQNE